MGESCRHQSPASVSLTLPEEPPHFQASEEPAPSLPSLPNGNIKGMPALALPLSCTGSRGAKTRGRSSLFRAAGTRGEPGGSATGCSLRWRRSTRAERRDRSPEPRAVGESRSCCTQSSLGPVPAPEIPRLVLHAQPGLLGGGRGGARDGGGGGAPIHRRRRCRPGLLHTPLSAPAGGEQFPRQDPGKGGKKKKGQNPERLVLTAKPWGARAVPLLHASAAAAGPAPRWDATRSPLGSVGLPDGSRAGHGLRRRAAGNAAGGAHCSPEPRCARRASEQHREPPLPCAAPSPRDAPQPGAGTPRLQQGEPRGALRLASRPSPGAAPDGSRVSEPRIRSLPSSPAGCTATWWV